MKKEFDLTTVKGRLKAFVDYLDISEGKFEEDLGISNGYVSSVKDSIGKKNLPIILAKYPNLNRDWLLFGEGSMLKEEDMTPKLSDQKEVILLGNHRGRERMNPQEIRDSYADWQGLPMYNYPINASFIERYQDTDTSIKPLYYLHDPRFRDCNFGAIITGDSMHSEIRHGDFVACKEIVDKQFIVFGEIYYIVAKNGLETCKYVARKPKNDAVINGNGRYKESDYDDEYILLVPYNKSIDPSPLHREMIDRIYKVRGIVRGY